METRVIVEAVNGVGWIRLNRPAAINSLSVDMVTVIERQLREWMDDQKIGLVCIYGEGTKGFCAGGDMRALYDRRDSQVAELAHAFFSTEYRMDLLIHQYPKPILAYMNGIVMGGGVGIAIGAKQRIVTELTKWAMPEMNIGFFPDVGASYFLSRMPGCVGRYFALTSRVIRAQDVLYAGAADRFMESRSWEALRGAIRDRRWQPSTADRELAELLDQCTRTDLPDSELAALREKIDVHFRFDTMEEIVASLSTAAQRGDEWARGTVDILSQKSPLSLKVTLLQLQKGKTMSLADCFQMEYTLAMNFMRNPDFYEGVRAVLVDKDRNPKWNVSSLEAVKEEDVSAFFQTGNGTGAPLSL